MRSCTYFTECDAFYQLIVWAELMRLMNTIQERLEGVQGGITPFPPLIELQRKFMAAKDRCEMWKKTSPRNKSQDLEYDKVAQNAFSMAVSARFEGCDI